ncbi:MAG: alpha-hydroxy-acid oxidizing protein [Rhodobiaceae bacterium]|nr:alpha-hydroxy-acid oxidizing protein [Rhodobiaceae bacterium]MCC0056580.1 alpha-hydroxy-acid oxidizing protein [Rhodobiaceae bacterium]
MLRGFKFRLTQDRHPASVEEYRQAAMRRLPSLVRAYIENGAEDEATLRANRGAFARWTLRQRVLTGTVKPRLETVIGGETITLPVMCAPTGFTALSHSSGDVAVARAAERAGTRIVLSTASSYSIEEVGAATNKPHGFQLYPFGNHEFAEGMLNRARESGYGALYVTVDVPVRGNRDAERRHGLTIPPVVSLGTALNCTFHPGWSLDLLRNGRLGAANYAPTGGLRGATMSDTITQQNRFMQTDLHWDDVAWMRDRWKGAFYIKGIMDVEDAVHAVEKIGVTGLVVSNHGGRQMDSAQGSLDALGAIGREVGGRAELILDGGVRRGTDVIKALCLGAKAVLIGRPYLYGLAAGGEDGVARVLEIFREELDRDLTLMGCPDIGLLDRSWLLPA